jgi:hypothetical protein
LLDGGYVLFNTRVELSHGDSYEAAETAATTDKIVKDFIVFRDEKEMSLGTAKEMGKRVASGSNTAVQRSIGKRR